MFELHQKVIDGPLAVRSTPYGDWSIVVSLAGELDGSTVATAARAIKSALSADELIVVIDLQELEFLDSSGVALLCGLYEEMSDSARIRVVPSRSLGVTQILTATGLDTMLKVVRDGVGGLAADGAVQETG